MNGGLILYQALKNLMYNFFYSSLTIEVYKLSDGSVQLDLWAADAAMMVHGRLPLLTLAVCSAGSSFRPKNTTESAAALLAAAHPRTRRQPRHTRRYRAE